MRIWCAQCKRVPDVLERRRRPRGLTESFGTAVALLIAFALGARQLAPEIAAIAGTLASGLVAFALARRLFPFTPVPRWPSDDLVRPLLSSSAPIALYDLLNIAIMRIDLIMLGWFVGRVPSVTLETLGIYAAAVEVGSGLRKVSQSFTPIFTPIVARQIAAGQIRDAEASYGYLARWMLMLLLPALVVLALAGGAIMTIFGPAFHRGGRHQLVRDSPLCAHRRGRRRIPLRHRWQQQPERSGHGAGRCAGCAHRMPVQYLGRHEHAACILGCTGYRGGGQVPR